MGGTWCLWPFVALLALAQINLLNPVNTPFPGRIWASDTFIFSGIWENTRGGFLTFRQTTGMSVRVLVFPLCHLQTSFIQFVWCRGTTANNAFHITCCMTWTDDPVWSSVLTRALLAQFSHRAVTLTCRRLHTKSLALFCCFHTFNTFHMFYGSLGWRTREIFH